MVLSDSSISQAVRAGNSLPMEVNISPKVGITFAEDPATPGFPNATQGFSFGLAHDPSFATATGFTPVGPLEFSLANPINDRDGDDTQTFQFALGAAF